MSFIENKVNGVTFMAAPVIRARHGFSTRWGGVSGGIFSSLNLAMSRGDDPEAVVENYRRITAAVGANSDA
ncbi:MAG: polyphenol oxidase family protein, partial [Oscillospiraceae bacterium]|nr:polyphenol oxidase family protein [Oscillospiraceae bacterium]